MPVPRNVKLAVENEPQDFNLDDYVSVGSFRGKPIFDQPEVIEQIDSGRQLKTSNGVITYTFLDKAFLTGLYNNPTLGFTAGFGLSPYSAEQQVAAVPARDPFPAVYTLQLAKTQDMRYGENPHQAAAFYRDPMPVAGSIANYKQLQGKELSYNNIADADAAWECVKSFDAPACTIVKHANPCGVAVGATLAEAYDKAWRTDPTSAFGGILAFNRPVDEATARRISEHKQFVEVLIAPGFDDGARALFAAKHNLRVLQVPLGEAANTLDFKRVGGGMLLQTADNRDFEPSQLKVVTKLQPTGQQMQDLLFAWKVAKFVKSNAIVFCGGGMTLGVGAGQMSRIDSARIARIKAGNAGLSLAASAVASDAFFPFRDGLDVVIDEGAACVIQPGGSMRDDEVIAAADERGIAMVFTGTRHFRH